MPANSKPTSREETLIFLLQHPLRKQLLRLCVEADEMRSPKELTVPVNRDISIVGYHVRVLAEYGAVELVAEQPRRGSVEGDTRRRSPLLATLTLAGLRISEALDLRWRDVNLDARRLRVAAAKTDAGVREVDLTPTLQELLADYRSRSPYTQPGDLVFPTGAGKRDNLSNVRNRFLDSAAKLANADLRAAGREPSRT